MLCIGETGRSLRTRFGEHRRAVIGNDANQPVVRHFSTGNHSVSDIEIRALYPISGSNDSRKRHEMRLISKDKQRQLSSQTNNDSLISYLSLRKFAA
jgi:UDP-N-acetyl-D-mannosaminuronate dehydrogenase